MTKRWRNTLIGVVATLTLLGIADVAFSIWAEDEIEDMLRFEPPKRAIVCEGPVDEACAKKTADGAQRIVAWMPDTDLLSSEYLLLLAGPAVPRPVSEGRVYQQLSSDRGVLITVYSHPANEVRSANAKRVRDLRRGDVSAPMYRYTDRDGEAFVRWAEHGEMFEISGTMLRLDRRQDLIEEAVADAFSKIRYAHVATAPPQA